MPRPARAAQVLAAGAAIALAGYLLFRPGTATQLESVMTDVQRGLAERDGALILDRLDPEYDLERHWPRQCRRLQALGSRYGNPEKDLRATLERVVHLYFLQRRPRAELTFRIESVEEDEGGRVRATITLGLRGRGLPFTIDPPVTRSFTFSREGGFWPRLRFLSHDPLL